MATPQETTTEVGPARKQQRRAVETRRRIVVAALEAFSRRGFDGTSTRGIAALAGVALARVTYHFPSKEDLWRAAASHVFETFSERMARRAEGLAGVDGGTTTRLLLREWICFAAEHPELHRFMQQEAMARTNRLRWLVETHVRPWFENLERYLAGTGAGPRLREPLRAAGAGHLYYMLIGAAATPYAFADEFELLTGFEPSDSRLVERHVDAVIELFFDERSDNEGS